MHLVRTTQSVLVAALTTLVGCAGQDATSSATTAAPASGGNTFVLGSGFAAEKRQGKTTGSVEVSACKVWIADKPDFTMTLTDQPMGNLRIQVTSDNGAEPVVRFQKGTFCAKKVEGAPPVVSRGAWSKDTYEIYIGVPENGQTVDYTLDVFEEP